MQLTELLNYISSAKVIGEVQRKDLSGVHYDSRKVKKNSIFVAIQGFKTDGHKFIPEALNKGAVAVVLENNDAFPDEYFLHTHSAKIIVPSSRRALAEISNALYKNVSSEFRLTGITGTNGKTTTAFFVKSILEQNGYKTGLLGTIKNMIGNKEISSVLTTPESNDLNELFLQMKNENCSDVVMEVSSHSLVLDRVYGLNFKGGVFTNFTSDHLDFHGTVENYLNAKKIFFDSLSESSVCVYNIDDPASEKLLKDTRAKIYSFGFSEVSDYRISNIFFGFEGTKFTIKGKSGEYPVSTSLIGDFNAYNAAAAFSITVSYGISPDIAVAGIGNTPQVPGRFELISREKKYVIVDYSHTADSLKKALLVVRKITPASVPVYTVFGCGGNRDTSKRPEMGKIASELSDMVIITNDNPRDEEPGEIINQILKGISNQNYKVILDREEAIKYAIRYSDREAVILIAGKGHETYQEIKGRRFHFSDKEIAEKYLS